MKRTLVRQSRFCAFIFGEGLNDELIDGSKEPRADLSKLPRTEDPLANRYESLQLSLERATFEASMTTATKRYKAPSLQSTSPSLSTFEFRRFSLPLGSVDLSPQRFHLSDSDTNF